MLLHVGKKDLCGPGFRAEVGRGEFRKWRSARRRIIDFQSRDVARSGQAAEIVEGLRRGKPDDTAFGGGGGETMDGCL